MAHGHIKLSRKMFDGHDDLWSDGSEFDARSAWIDLIQLAAFKGHRKRVGNRFVALQRGEILASLRFLGERWGWGRHRVSNYLEMLEDIGRVVTVRGTPGGTVYRLAKYEDYQTHGDRSGDSKRDTKGTGRGQVGDKENTRSKGSKGSKTLDLDQDRHAAVAARNGVAEPVVGTEADIRKRATSWIVGRWVEACQERGVEPSATDRRKQGAAASRIATTRPLDQIPVAVDGISRLWQFDQGGSLWDCFDLERLFTKAVDANANPPKDRKRSRLDKNLSAINDAMRETEAP